MVDGVATNSDRVRGRQDKMRSCSGPRHEGKRQKRKEIGTSSEKNEPVDHETTP